MNQIPKYVTTSDGRTARVIVSFKDDYVDYYAYTRLKSNTEKREVAHELVDILGENIYSNILNEVIDFLEKLEAREKYKTRNTSNDN
jgi:hypothetical protein